MALTAALLALALAAHGQGVRVLRVGGTEASWRAGGNGTSPLVLVGTTFSPLLDTTNTPGDAIDFTHQPGWISPLYFDADANVAARVLQEGGNIAAPNAVEEKKVVNAQLPGIVNGDHDVAFERKPTPVVPLSPLGIWTILDFGTPIGVHRVRFYPRNTVVATPQTPFHNDFMRAYELLINQTLTSAQRSPDILVARDTANDEAIVDLDVPLQYTRLVKLKSLTQVPWEIDEIEVYATGYLQRATYLSDLIDLRDRATLGTVSWSERPVGRAIRAQTTLRLRTGTDDTPFIYHRRVLDSLGVWLGESEVVDGPTWVRLDRRERGLIKDDEQNWSPWRSEENGQLVTAPGQRRYAQFQVDIEGQMFDTRQVNWVQVEYLQPPLADTLRAEVFPRSVPAEKRATFRYAVLLRATGAFRGYDSLAVDANAGVENIRELTVNGRPAPFNLGTVSRDGFSLSFAPVRTDSTVLEFTFDVPVFRFGTTFAGRAFHRASGALPQRLEPGNAADFGPTDFAELSGLSVVIPRDQVGQLVGEIVTARAVFTPNGDLINDEFEVFFNLLQLTKPTRVTMDLYDLSGRLVHTLFDEEKTIGPALHRWDGRLRDGHLAPPGQYVWVLRVEADAFEERHTGVLGVAY